MSWSNFVNELAHFQPANGSPICNPYRLGNEENATRCNNLRIYLEMVTQQPCPLLVGEALGYRGGRVTGIPFVSQSVLTTQPFFADGDFLALPSSHPQKEATATIMWQVLGQFDHPPLLWNAFPFHPHQPNRPNSNRRPSNQELKIGRNHLQHLLNLADVTTIIAVGNRAHDTLTKMKVACKKVRHPSHGGKQAFTIGLLKIIKSAPSSV